MRIKVPKAPEDKELDVMPDLKVKLSDLTEAMEKQAGLFVYYASLADAALQDQKDVKYQIYCRQEDLDGELRSKFEKAGQKFTEASLKPAINRDPQLRKLFERHRRRSRDAGQLKVFTEALKAKKDMLQMLGAMSRAEREGEVRTFESKWKAKIAKPQHGKGETDGDK